MENKPILGVLLGDSAGVGPELVARLAADQVYTNYCRPIIIGDVRIFRRGLSAIGQTVEHHTIRSVDQADWESGIPVLDTADQDPAQITMSESSNYCGAASVAMIEYACRLCKDGDIAGFVFAPFNKSAMKQGGCQFESEHHLFAHLFGVQNQPFGEINMLENLMTTRTTSHIPIKEVSGNLSIETISRAVRLAYITAKSSGISNPRLGVCALNPHGGEDGRCGREEIEIITPAVEQAKKEGLNITGPFPADTLFIKAFQGEFDGIVTMFHDQGQIALKLRGFDKGITVAGGQPYPIVTCAHGTAYDIAGKGIASPSAFENAVIVASKMAAYQTAAKLQGARA